MTGIERDDDLACLLSTPGLFCVTFGSDRSIRLCSDSAAELVGIDRELLTGTDVSGILFHGTSAVAGAPDKGDAFCSCYRDLLGGRRYVEWYIRTFGSDGHATQLVAFGSEVTSHRDLVLRLKSREGHYRSIIERQGEGVGLVDADETFVYANPAAEGIFGVPTGTLAGRNLRDFMNDIEYGRIRQQTERRRQSEVDSYEVKLHRLDGTVIDLLVTAAPRTTPDGAFLGSFGIFRDITVRRREQERLAWELRVNEALTKLSQALLDPDSAVEDVAGLVLHNARGITDSSGGFVSVREAGGSSVLACCSPSDGMETGPTGLTVDAAVGEEVLGSIGLYGRFGAYDAKSRDAVRRLADLFAVFLLRDRDEAQRSRLEAQMQHAQKLESLGVLAGGIAHDFNNLLTAILGSAELALEAIGAEAAAADHVKQIKETAGHAAGLTRQMLAYSGTGTLNMCSHDLSRIVGDMERMLRLSMSKRTRLDYDLPEDPVWIRADSSQIRQVVMNLVINGSEASENGAGSVTVKAGERPLQREELRRCELGRDLPEGRYAFLSVSDTGSGIEEQFIDRIFDPFFSTKFTGRGLGLAAVLGVVRGHGGCLSVRSVVGKGTVFELFLPCSPKPGPEVESAETATERPWRGQGAVLIADDEPAVLSVAAAMVGRLGFEVFTAADGAAAVEQFVRKPERFACVILDVTMPVMDGKEALTRIVRARPDCPVIMSSGFGETEDALDAAAAFMSKPYGFDELRSALRTALVDRAGQ